MSFAKGILGAAAIAAALLAPALPGRADDGGRDCGRADRCRERATARDGKDGRRGARAHRADVRHERARRHLAARARRLHHCACALRELGWRRSAARLEARARRIETFLDRRAPCGERGRGREGHRRRLLV
jgi:hypothetical protein